MVTVDGPLFRGVKLSVEPVDGDLTCMIAPTGLYEWPDTRVLRDAAGPVRGLCVSGTRVRNLMFARMP
jgi:hypothetical protein